MLGNPANRHRAVPLTYEQFRFGFANAVSEDEAKELYETFAVPAPGAPLFQAATANLNPWTEAKVDSKNPDRGPLLIISGEKDNTVPWAIANASYKKQKRNEGVTEIVEIPEPRPRADDRQRLARGRRHRSRVREAFRLASRNRLDGPAVSVRVAEEDERAPRELLHLADLDPAGDELRMRSVNVGHHQLQALDRARRHVAEPRSDRDRAARPGRRQLDEADLVADLVVVVGVEADLLGVESLRAVDVRDRNLHELESPIHDGILPIRRRRLEKERRDAIDGG